MYIDTVPNRNSPPAILLRQSVRQGSRIRKRTLANLSHWPASKPSAVPCAERSIISPILTPNSAPASDSFSP